MKKNKTIYKKNKGWISENIMNTKALVNIHDSSIFCVLEDEIQKKIFSCINGKNDVLEIKNKLKKKHSKRIWTEKNIIDFLKYLEKIRIISKT